MAKISLFERDFKAAEVLFPKLHYSFNAEHKFWRVRGELDICDVKGVYWNTFDILLMVPESYPYCVPILAEMSEIIPREIDWHVSPDGLCCMDVDNNLIVLSKRGINLARFITDKVYSFFANQLYRLEAHQYAGQEYGHHVIGVLQYYREKLHMESPETVLAFIEIVLHKKTFGRNAACPCGSGTKFKYCHLEALNIMQLLGDQKLEKDKENILSYIAII